MNRKAKQFLNEMYDRRKMEVGFNFTLLQFYVANQIGACLVSLQAVILSTSTTRLHVILTALLCIMTPYFISDALFCDYIVLLSYSE
jgi:hypothetical protein